MIMFALSTFALVLISITMLCRANDLRWRSGLQWQIRLMGFVTAGASPIGVIAMEWATHTWPSPYEVAFRFGLLMVFVTTPQLPPWWRWVSGKEEASDTN